MNRSREFSGLQKRRFSRAEIKRFLWQTQNSYVRPKEEELLATVVREEADSILEVGCGEGANIHNLRGLGCPTTFTGIDFSLDKAKFCHTQNLNSCIFLCADALFLPFRDGLFDLVYCRDVLHHVSYDRKKLMSEIIRVCKRDARIAIIESNGKKLTLMLFSILSRAERGMIDSAPEKIKRMIKEFENTVIMDDFFMCEPSNLFRIVLHHRFGLPILADFKWFREFLHYINFASMKVLPENRWAYSVAMLRKRA